QAISAMAWGTTSCPRYKDYYYLHDLFPLPLFLSLSICYDSIGMPAGPSEVLVIADKYANPVHIAPDLLSQAEYGPDSQAVLVVSGNGVNLSAIEDEISK
ncbi:Histidinol dehydrogenase chloroplastic, partial [Bienertia sinuspersici]